MSKRTEQTGVRTFSPPGLAPPGSPGAGGPPSPSAEPPVAGAAGVDPVGHDVQRLARAGLSIKDFPPDSPFQVRASEYVPAGVSLQPPDHGVELIVPSISFD